MSGAATSNESRVVRRLVPLLVVAALLTALPFGGSSNRTTAGRDDRRAGLDRAHTFALTDTTATRPQGQDRRDIPVAALPALGAAALIALAGTFVARNRFTTSTKPRVAFRRRAPPSFQTAY